MNRVTSHKPLSSELFRLEDKPDWVRKATIFHPANVNADQQQLRRQQQQQQKLLYDRHASKIRTSQASWHANGVRFLRTYIFCEVLSVNNLRICFFLPRFVVFLDIKEAAQCSNWQSIPNCFLRFSQWFSVDRLYCPASMMLYFLLCTWVL